MTGAERAVAFTAFEVIDRACRAFRLGSRGCLA